MIVSILIQTVGNRSRDSHGWVIPYSVVLLNDLVGFRTNTGANQKYSRESLIPEYNSFRELLVTEMAFESPLLIGYLSLQKGYLS